MPGGLASGIQEPTKINLLPLHIIGILFTYTYNIVNPHIHIYIYMYMGVYDIRDTLVGWGPDCKGILLFGGLW